LWPEPGLGALVIDFIGEPLGVVMCTGLLAMICVGLGRWRLAIVVVGLGMTGVVTAVLKPVVGRTIHEGFLAYPKRAHGDCHRVRPGRHAAVHRPARRRDAVRRAVDPIRSRRGRSDDGTVPDSPGRSLPDGHHRRLLVAMVVMPATAYLIDRVTAT